MAAGTWESAAMRALREHLRETSLLRQAAGVLSWDQQVYMPPGGAAARGQAQGQLSKLAHERLASPRVGKLLAELEPQVAALDPASDAAALVRLVRRHYDRATKLPPELVVELSEASAAGYAAWVRAREEKNFALFAGHLERQFELARRASEHLGYAEHPYDACLDGFEPGLRTADVDALFGALRARLAPLAQRLAGADAAVDDSVLRQHFPGAQQLELAAEALRLMGFDFERGRLDLTVHPFCLGIVPADVRLTTRVDEGWFSNCFFSAVHEGGHGLYEQGLPAEFDGLPLAETASLGIHESQSRLWENMIGRSLGFWEYFLPVAQRYFPDQLAGVTPAQMYRAVNKTQPSFIRTEADEVTYNLHVMLRFDLEKDLLTGAVRVADLPELWNAKMEAYLGLTPPDDSQGVLQDVHWSGGMIGYFPTYTMGTVASVQLYDAAVAEHPSIPADIARGDLSALLDWMRRHVHRHGSRYTPAELLEQATGQPLSVEPYLAYIEQKYGALYRLDGD